MNSIIKQVIFYRFYILKHHTHITLKNNEISSAFELINKH